MHIFIFNGYSGGGLGCTSAGYAGVGIVSAGVYILLIFTVFYFYFIVGFN